MFVKVAVGQQFRLRVMPDIKSLIFGGGKEVHYIGGTEVLPPPPLPPRIHRRNRPEHVPDPTDSLSLRNRRSPWCFPWQTHPYLSFR